MVRNRLLATLIFLHEYGRSNSGLAVVFTLNLLSHLH